MQIDLQCADLITRSRSLCCDYCHNGDRISHHFVRDACFEVVKPPKRVATAPESHVLAHLCCHMQQGVEDMHAADIRQLFAYGAMTWRKKRQRRIKKVLIFTERRRKPRG